MSWRAKSSAFLVEDESELNIYSDLIKRNRGRQSNYWKVVVSTGAFRIDLRQNLRVVEMDKFRISNSYCFQVYVTISATVFEIRRPNNYVVK